MIDLEKIQREFEFDPVEKLVRCPVTNKVSYHTALKGGYVHPVRESLEYALVSLEIQDESAIGTAKEIIDRVLLMQDTNPESETCGVWPWYFEEPLEKMNPPDYNWANFIGRLLLQISLFHQDKFDAPFHTRIKDAAVRAAQFIAKRDVGPEYTNIAAMGMYVTVIAGETYGEESLLNYGKEVLEKFLDYTVNVFHGFGEYNSPCYSVELLNDLNRFVNHVHDEEARQKGKQLLERVWRMILEHIHMPTKQWSGPHSRTYSNLVSKEFLARIQYAAGIDLTEEDSPEVFAINQLDELRCPKEVISQFSQYEAERTVSEAFGVCDRDRPFRRATTYFTETYTLGTFHKSDFWNQRRPLMAYFAGPDAPMYMRMRVLHDGYDFSSALLHCVQVKESVVGIVNFCTNGGTMHPHYAPLENGAFNTSDLRLRIEFGTNSLPCDIKAEGDTFAVQLPMGLTIRMAVPFAMFNGQPCALEINKTEDGACIDIVFHTGQEIRCDLNSVAASACGIGISVSDQKPQVVVVLEDEYLHVNGICNGEIVEVSACALPDLLMAQYGKSIGKINGEDYSEPSLGLK